MYVGRQGFGSVHPEIRMIEGRIIEVLLYIRHLKENLLRGKLQLNKTLYMKQLAIYLFIFQKKAQ